MHYQYHCACCNRVVEANQKVCNDCGSHNIRSPIGFWIFCMMACLIAAVVVKAVHVYLQHYQETPVATSFFEILKEENKNPSK
jgi:hypothetical protein